MQQIRFIHNRYNRLTITQIHNMLTINCKKTNGLIINRHVESSHFEPFRVRNNRVTFVNEFKLIGDLIDSKLLFESHVRSIKSKAGFKSHIISIRKARSLFLYKLRLTIFKLFVVPYFDYCSTVFFQGVSKCYFDSLVKAFHKNLRITLNIT